MPNYRSIKTDELRKMLRDEAARLKAKKDAVIADYDELIAMRKELDRREGTSHPVAQVDIENYLTD